MQIGSAITESCTLTSYIPFEPQWETKSCTIRDTKHIKTLHDVLCHPHSIEVPHLS